MNPARPLKQEKSKISYPFFLYIIDITGVLIVLVVFVYIKGKKKERKEERGEKTVSLVIISFKLVTYERHPGRYLG